VRTNAVGGDDLDQETAVEPLRQLGLVLHPLPVDDIAGASLDDSPSLSPAPSRRHLCHRWAADLRSGPG